MNNIKRFSEHKLSPINRALPFATYCTKKVFIKFQGPSTVFLYYKIITIWNWNSGEG